MEDIKSKGVTVLRSTKMLIAGCVLLAACSIVRPAAAEEDLWQLMNTFYNGLAHVVEQNMENPANCVRAVDKYYENNTATVEKIRILNARYMAKAETVMRNYQETGMDEFANLGELQELEGSLKELNSQSQQSGEGMERYAKALEQFSMKHPGQGMAIAAKVARLMPQVR